MTACTPASDRPRILDYTATDLPRSPMIVFYEVTRACDLACRHCRACAQPMPSPDELTTEQAHLLMQQIASFPRPPMLVFTGGDPLKRPDIFSIIRAGAAHGLKTALTPSATALVTTAALQELRRLQIDRLAVSLDGVDAITHDAFRGVPGSYQRTLDILTAARDLGISMQVNTTLTPRNVDQIDAFADLLERFGIALWSVFFLVPTGRGSVEPRLSAEACERAFARLWANAAIRPYAIKTTEAPHYRRFALQQRDKDRRSWPRASVGTNDGKGVIFVSHTGRISPSGFLPLDCGRFPVDSVVEVYQRHPIFVGLRDATMLKGKCGACEFRNICGGSRARSFAVTGDAWQAEPDCIHVPGNAQPPCG